MKLLLIFIAFFSFIDAYADSESLKIEMLPSEYNGLAEGKKQELIENIAVQSFMIFQQVKDKGLEESKDDLLKVIEARQWLEATNDTMARVLAMSLQFNLDSCVISEVANYELYNAERGNKSTEHSFDYDEIVDELVSLNGIDEEEYISFSLPYNPIVMDNVQKSNLTVRDIVNKNRFRQLDKKLFDFKITLTGKYFGARVNQQGGAADATSEFEVPSDQPIMPLIFTLAQNITSKDDLHKLLLPLSIGLIESRADVSFLIKVFRDDRQSETRAIIEDKDIGFNEGLKKCIKSEFSKKQSDHMFLFGGKYDDAKGDLITRSRIRKRLGQRIRSSKTDYFIEAVIVTICPFVQNVAAFPEKYQKDEDFISNCGVWLRFI